MPKSYVKANVHSAVHIEKLINKINRNVCESRKIICKLKLNEERKSTIPNMSTAIWLFCTADSLLFWQNGKTLCAFDLSSLNWSQICFFVLPLSAISKPSSLNFPLNCNVCADGSKSSASKNKKQKVTRDRQIETNSHLPQSLLIFFLKNGKLAGNLSRRLL